MRLPKYVEVPMSDLQRDAAELKQLRAAKPGWAASEIDAERKRQVSDEKYNSWHDDEHTDGSLRVVAAILCCADTDAHVEDALGRSDWNLLRHSIERRLVIAGALIAAEMERIQRAKNYAKQPEPTSQPTAPAVSGERGQA
jgi:hypothetical protein